MEVEQRHYSDSQGWKEVWLGGEDCNKAQLILGFGSPQHVQDPEKFRYLQSTYPHADIILASTAGEILDEEVFDDTLCVSALFFEKTPIQVFSEKIAHGEDSFEVGEVLSKKIPKPNLKHVLVISDGLNVNGSELIRGLRSHLDVDVLLTGGLAGDGVDFKETFVGLNQAAGSNKMVVVVGFYGDVIQIGSGCMGGWDNFGVKRIVTKSEGNVVYSLDDTPILDLYRQYLGDVAQELPGAGLLFPLTISKDGDDNSVVRTLLGVDEETKSMTFAGDIPIGYTAQLMRANFERLIDAASSAANNAQTILGDMEEVDFALLVSCVGRKLVLKQRVEEEIEGVRSIIGPSPKIAGFYSYGEIGPAEQDIIDCKLHNQTMTITLFSES